jgi:hypothetical protein
MESIEQLMIKSNDGRGSERSGVVVLNLAI